MTGAVRRFAHHELRRRAFMRVLAVLATVIGLLTMHAVVTSAAPPTTPAVAHAAGDPASTVMGAETVSMLSSSSLAESGTPPVLPKECGTECELTVTVLAAFCALAVLTVLLRVPSPVRILLLLAARRRSGAGWNANRFQEFISGTSPLSSLCISRT